jgi:hypothetical protein
MGRSGDPSGAQHAAGKPRSARGGWVMEEGMSTKAIPLRRSRSTTRGSIDSSSGLTARIGSGLLMTAAPARSLWLATLGGTSFAIRGASTIWRSLIAEGASIERWLRGLPPPS